MLLWSSGDTGIVNWSLVLRLWMAKGAELEISALIIAKKN
jgi:hypothetical protein